MRNDLLGKQFETNGSGKCFIIEFESYKKDGVVVVFYEPFCLVKCSYDNLCRGGVSNPMLPKLYGKGFLGSGKYSTTVNKREYELWSGILERCYSSDYKRKQPTYKTVTVCDEWLNFQNFAAWCETQEFFNSKDEKGKPYQLDKDILVRGNKLYSPETCCFVPSEVNKLLTLRGLDRGDLPIGVCRQKGTDKFLSQCNYFGRRKHLGVFKTPEEAFIKYKTFKELYIKEVAEKWSGRISERTYSSLLKYEVLVDD